MTMAALKSLKYEKHRPVIVLGLTLLGLLCTTTASAQQKGFLYVNQHISVAEARKNGHAHVDVYVYLTDGTIVHSGVGTGAFKVGAQIPLEPGEYLVELGRHRTQHNLQQYKVLPRKVTVVKTGWVSVSTWERSAQPEGPNCSKWDAGMRAMRVVDGKEYLIMSNTDKRPGASAMMQLPVGKVRVYFNGLAVDVEVKAHKNFSLPVGEAGPFRSKRVRLFSEKSERGGVPSVSICDNISSHVLAGKWWLSELVTIDEHPYEKRSWSEYQVKTLSGGDYNALKTDGKRGAGHSGEGGKLLSRAQIKALSGYKEGALTKSIGGKFKGTALESLFEDPTDVK